MARFTTDYVNLIANNLRDRYKTGFPVLKELVQNADDAGAKSLAFGYHPGFGGAVDHDLLKGPALWVMNDGQFSRRDREAIRSFGLNSKAAESGAIGKFGLGMKSVFHLCEAFFYLACDGEERYVEILNPWLQDSGNHPMHERWEQIRERDRECMLGIVKAQSEYKAARSWFMLWVPLRRRQHVDLTDGRPFAAIIDRFPGDAAGKDLDFFTEPDIDHRISLLLPLLRNLEQVRFGGTDSMSSFGLRLQASGGSERLDHDRDGIEMRGTVNDTADTREYLRFLARQRVVSQADSFQLAMRAPTWPKSMVIADGGHRTQVPDKARPEGAIMVGATAKRAGRLIVQWAVFLPTEELRFSYEFPIENGSKEYRIVLHGQFFVDAGRRGIGDMEVLHEEPLPAAVSASEAALMRFWNQALAQEVVLPLLPTVLARFVEDAGLKDAEVAALTLAIVNCAAVGDAGSRVQFYSTFSRFVTAEHGWARRLTPTGSAWQQFATPSERLLPLPAPPASDPGRPWRALPGLHQMPDSAFVDQDAPKLMPRPLSWDSESFLKTLRRVGADAFRSQTELDYLTRFLQLEKNRLLGTGEVQDAICEMLRRCIGALELADLRQHRSLFRSLVTLLPSERVFAIGPADPNAKSAISQAHYKRLLACATRALPLPGDLSHQEKSSKISADDLITWLRALVVSTSLGTPETAADLSNRLDLAEHLIVAAGNASDQASLVGSVRSLRVLRATVARTSESVDVSLDMLIEQHQKRLLFRAATATERLGHVPLLAETLPETQPLVISRAVAEWVDLLGEAQRPIPASIHVPAILNAVGGVERGPRLGGQDARKRMLTLVRQMELDDPFTVRGVRYLLHGDVDGYLRDDVLWKDPSGQQSPWVKLWRMVAEATWNVLDPGLCSVLPDACLDKLNVKLVAPGSVLNRLRVCRDFSRVNAVEFTREELDTILGEVSDEDAWRRLPLHCDWRGQFGSIDSACYLGTNPEPPDGFVGRLRLIPESLAPAHANHQAAWIAKWSAAQAAEAVLQSATPVVHWRYLMDLLARHRALQASPPAVWRTTPWLPLMTGGAIALDSLIRLDGLEGEIASLATKCDHAYSGPDFLALEVRQHEAAASLRRQIPAGPEALPPLGALMNEAGLAVGSAIAHAYMSGGASLATLSCLNTLPAWGIVEKAAACTSEQGVKDHLLPAIATQLSVEQAEGCLRELADSSADQSLQGLTMSVLQEWTQSGSATMLKGRLSNLRLPNQVGAWVPAGDLVDGAFSLERDVLLARSAALILSSLIVSNDVPPVAGQGLERDHLPSDTKQWDGKTLVRGLREIFEPLSESSVREGAGAVIGLFGYLAASQAKEWLGAIAYEDYLERLGWKDPGTEAGPDQRIPWMGNKNLDQALRALKFTVRIGLGSAADVFSLLGKPLRVRLLPLEQSETLLTGGFWWQGDGVVVSLRNPADLTMLEPKEQHKILQRTAEEMLSKIYNQKHANLDLLWELFSEADQVTLNVARGLILDGLPQLLKTLPGVSKVRKIAAALSALDEARRKRESARSAHGNVDGRQSDVDAASIDLATLVEEDADVQDAVLDGIRQRVSHNQYEVSSIPFELFQNADDAVEELQGMRQKEGRAVLDRADVGRFIMRLTEQTARFVHWGRPVNYTGRHGSFNPDFASDLERMLMLGASSKGNEENVTGKFGLGFKSVLLATDRPRVWSGDLRFEVIAGCLPHRWKPQESTTSFLNEQQGHGRVKLRSTLVELPIASSEHVAEVRNRFIALHGLLTVFARHIRHIVADDVSTTWAPRMVVELPSGCLEVGASPVPVGAGIVQGRLLVFRSSSGAVVLRLSADGFTSFDADVLHPVPAVWVVAPTRGHSAKGIAVSAKFAIDTGRATLASGKTAMRNHQLVLTLAFEVAPLILRLEEKSRNNWDELRHELSCTLVEEPTAFWTSFWDHVLCEQPDADTAEDLRLVDVFARTVFKRVQEQNGSVPNGLPGGLAAMVKFEDLRLAIDPHRHAHVVTALTAWPSFQRTWPERQWCSAQVLEWLNRSEVLSDESNIKEFTKETVRSIFQDAHFPAHDVEGLSAVLSGWPKGLPEEYGWRNELGTLQLRTEGGAWVLAKHILRGENPDVQLLSLFAPKAAILDAAYQANKSAWRQIDVLLPPWQHEPLAITNWCVAAGSLEAQSAVARWLLHNLYSPVIDGIRKRVDSGWMGDLGMDHPALASLSVEERTHLLVRLGFDPSLDVAERSPLSTELDMSTIHRWWRAVRKEQLSKYERRLWPAHVTPAALGKEEVDRDAWMALFCLGLFQRFGRATKEQHKGFLDFLQSNGWWHTISQVHPDQAPEAWMNILAQYAEDRSVDSLFELWMDSFHRLYRVARWLPDYVHIARTLDQRSEVELAQWLTPSIDPVLSGSGIDAPSLGRMLHLGQHLVVRELLRAGVLAPGTLTSYAYMPGSALRELMADLGFPGLESSQEIHEALTSELGDEDASFDGDYDIPLQLLATDRDVLQKVIAWANDHPVDEDLATSEET